MNLAQFLAILRASRWTILAMTLVAVIVAYSFASTLPKQYTAKARVMLDMSGDAPIQAISLDRTAGPTYIGTQMQLVGDTAVTRAVVEKLGWKEDPTVIAAWQAQTGGQGDIVKWAAARVSSNMSVGQLENSAILEIYYTASELEVAKRIVGLLRTAYIENDQKLQVSGAQRGAAWNRNQAVRALAALRAAERSRLEFLEANKIVDPGPRGFEAQQNSMLASAVAVPLPVSGPVLPSSAMSMLRRQLNDAEAQLATMMAVYGPENPATIVAQIHRDQLQRDFNHATDYNNSGANVTVEMTAANRRVLEAEYLRTRLAVLDRAPLYDRLSAFDREIELRTTFYQAAVARTQRYAMIAASPSGIRVIGDVIGSDEPTFPDIPVIVGVAAGLTALLGVVLVVFSEMLARRVHGSDDLVFFARAPVLAVIAAGPARPRRRWIAFGRRDDTPVPQPAE